MDGQSSAEEARRGFSPLISPCPMNHSLCAVLQSPDITMYPWSVGTKSAPPRSDRESTSRQLADWVGTFMARACCLTRLRGWSLTIDLLATCTHCSSDKHEASYPAYLWLDCHTRSTAMDNVFSASLQHNAWITCSLNAPSRPSIRS